jgi:hypothetical protein
MIHRVIIDKIAEEKALTEAFVTNGQINDIAVYRFYIGKIQAFQDAIDIIINIFQEKKDE